jgi:transaldolase
MRPQFLKTKIFLDSGNPVDTKRAIETLGFLDGQTTNPTLIAKHPLAQERIQTGQLFSANEALGLYKEIVQEIHKVIPRGAISIEVYADETTTMKEMLVQADEFQNWIPHPYIKFPITSEGLAAAEQAIVDGMRVNMTLCFSQEQAAAVYAATRGVKDDRVFLSPFVGRLDDQRKQGLDLVRHIMTMFQQSDHHVQVLAASIRTVEHLVQSIEAGANCLTAPLNVLSEWAGLGFPVSFTLGTSSELHPIDYQEIDLTKGWKEYQITHELTSMGLQKFVSDWNSLVQ